MENGNTIQTYGATKMESPKTLEGANYQNNVAECCGTCELTGGNDVDYHRVY